MIRSTFLKVVTFAVIAGGSGLNLVAASPQDSKGIHMADVKPGTVLTFECKQCKSKVTAKVESSSGDAKVAVNDKGEPQTVSYVCPACQAKGS